MNINADLIWTIIFYIWQIGFVMPFYGAVILFLLFIAHILMELVIKKLDEDDEILSPFPASWNFAVLFYGLGAAYFLGWYIYLNNPG